MRPPLIWGRALVVVTVLATAAAGLAITWSGAAPAVSGLSSMSNHGGAPITLVAADEPLIRIGAAQGLTVADVRPLGVVGAITFYRIGSTHCYATGPGAQDEQLGSLFCTKGFPSASQPVVVKLQGKGGPDPRITATGLAADAVVTVQFRDGVGHAVETSAVRDNVFGLIGVSAVRLHSFVALDATGKVVYSVPVSWKSLSDGKRP